MTQKTSQRRAPAARARLAGSDRRAIVFLAAWVFLAFGAGAGLLSGLLESYQDRGLRLSAEATDQESSFLASALEQDLGAVRAGLAAWSARADRAYAWEGSARPLLLSEVGVKDNQLAGVSREIARPGWSAALPVGADLTFEEAFHRRLLSGLSLQEMRSRPLSVLRFKIDPESGREWLVVALLSANGAVVSALLEPEDTFPLFGRWRIAAAKGDSRAYVVGSDGRVLLHSMPSYVGSDLSRTPLFQAVARELFSGGRDSGRGAFRGLDQVGVWASYSRIARLPLSLVVEKPTARARVRIGEDLGFGALLACAALAGLCVGGFYLFRARLVRSDPAAPGRPDPLEAAARRLPELRAARAEAEASAAAEAARLLSGGVLSLEIEEGGASRAFEPVDPDLVKLARYESELAAVSDPSRIADRLLALAGELTGRPALFFGFHPRHGAAILQASRGFMPGQVPEGMSFPIHLKALQQFLASEPASTVASFADYPSLTRMLEARLKSSRYDAWGITVHRGLVGVLVVLKRGEAASIRPEILARMVHVAGATYGRCNP